MWFLSEETATKIGVLKCAARICIVFLTSWFKKKKKKNLQSAKERHFLVTWASLVEILNIDWLFHPKLVRNCKVVCKSRWVFYTGLKDFSLDVLGHPLEIVAVDLGAGGGRGDPIVGTSLFWVLRAELQLLPALLCNAVTHCSAFLRKHTNWFYL